MKTRTKFAILDTVFNYVLFTPLVLLFWYGTYALIDAVILSPFKSRLVGATVTLLLGFSVEFTIIYWQVRVRHFIIVILIIITVTITCPISQTAL